MPATLATVRFFLMYEPGKSHLDSILSRAGFALEQGIITALPVITTEAARIPCFVSVVLTVPAADRSFWIGFTMGVDFCRNNRAITVGVEGSSA